MNQYNLSPRERIGPLNINIFPNDYDSAIIQSIIDEEKRKDEGNQIPLEKPVDMPYEPPEQIPEKQDRVVIILPKDDQQNKKGFVIIQM
jgi:hypothetical protein